MRVVNKISKKITQREKKLRMEEEKGRKGKEKYMNSGVRK